MVQQVNNEYYFNKNSIIDRKNNSFLLAICPKCGNTFEMDRGFYAMYLAIYCPYCNAFIHFHK